MKKKRARNAAHTKQAILESAMQFFAQNGYDQVGVREIAKGAGVTAMLVNRYFGSKENLFAKVIAETMKTPTILSPENRAAPDFAEAMASALVSITNKDDSPLIGFMILLRSMSNKHAAAIGRVEIEKGNHLTMTNALEGDLAPERAAVLISLIAGFQVMRQMFGLSALADAKPEVLQEILTPIFKLLVTQAAVPSIKAVPQEV